MTIKKPYKFQYVIILNNDNNYRVKQNCSELAIDISFIKW